MSQELRVDITGNSKGLQKATKQADKNLQNFNNGLKNIAGNLAAAFGTREIIAFSKQAVQTAGKVEGVRKAFEKLNGANLDDLRKATAGTVSDLELMQEANLAAKLGLDVKQLGNLFAFASKTAQETGQSVEYLTSSIVRGIGRKSVLILDNLGISAVQLKEALGGVSLEAASVAQVTEAVGKIAAQNMGDAVGVIETAEIKTARLNAAWQNLTATFGTRASGSYEIVIDFLAQAVKGLDEFLKTSNQLAMGKGMTSASDFLSGLSNVSDVGKRKSAIEAEVNRLKEYRDRMNELGVATTNNRNAWQRLQNNIGITTDNADGFFDKSLEIAESIRILEEAMTSLNETSTGESSMFSEGYQKAMDSFALKMAALTAETAYLGSDTLQGRIDATRAAIIALGVEGSEPAREMIERLKASLAALQAQVRTTGDVAPLADPTKPSVITTPTGAPAMPSPDVSAMSNFDFKLDEWVKKVQAFNEISQEVGFTWENLGVQFTQVFTGMLQEGTLTFKGLLTALIRLITKMMTALIITTALRSAMGDAGAAPRAAAAAAAIGTAIGGLLASSIPELATGGVVTSPTLALIGEGRESEAVLPLSKLDAMMQGGGGGYVETRIDGQDLILMIDRARRFNGRING